MADVRALEILSKLLNNYRNLPNIPTSITGVDGYTLAIKKTRNEAEKAIKQIKKYVEDIEAGINEVAIANDNFLQQNQDALKNIFSQLRHSHSAPSQTYTGSSSDANAAYNSWSPVTEGILEVDKSLDKKRNSQDDQLKLALELQKAVKSIMNDRLDELIKETEIACSKAKKGITLLSEDIDNLIGCVDSWQNAKHESHAEEKRKQEEERKRREAVQKRRREEQAKREKERKEQKEREERERRQREREEAERKAEEERQRKEEEERMRREKEERRKREEEERIKRKAEEKRLKEEAERKAEEERLRKAEEERLRKEEEERMRKEEEERRKREEEERIKREAEEKRLKEEAERKRRVEEAARKREEERKRREEERKERERLKREAEEKAWRQDPNNWKPFVYERKCDEVDGRREYHGGISCVLTSPSGGIEEDDVQCLASDEIDSIITVLEDDEKPVSSIIELQSRNGELHSEKSVKPMAGIEVNDFANIKIAVVSRPKSQLIIVDRPGTSIYSTYDNQVKLFVPRDTFANRTEMRLRMQPVDNNRLSGLMTNDSSLENVLSVGSVITLQSQKLPNKSIEVDLMQPKSNQANGSKYQRGKFHQLYSCRDKAWKIAETEYKGPHNHVTVGIPSGLDKVMVMEVEVSNNVPKEQLPYIAEVINTNINKTIVQMIVLQQSSNPKCVSLRIVPKEETNHVQDHLKSKGFNEVKVKDNYKQKDLPSFIGTIRCALLEDNLTGPGNVSSSLEMTIVLPKSVLEALMGKRGLKTGHRNAMRKIEDTDDEVLLFKTILLDWMKSQQKHVDKIKPILSALIRNGHTVIASQCEEYVTYQKVNVTDDVVKEISRNATRNVDDIGQELGLSEKMIKKCIDAHPENIQQQIEGLLVEWRESEDAMRHDNVRDYMQVARSGAKHVVEEIQMYVSSIESSIRDVNKVNEDFLRQNQENLKKIFSQLRHSLSTPSQMCAGSSSGENTAYDSWSPVTEGKMVADLSRVTESYSQTNQQVTERNSQADQLKLALELQKAVKSIMNDRLDELIRETETACGKAKKGTTLMSEDIDNLIGCVDSWQKAKRDSHAEEKRKQEEERKRREEQAKKEKERKEQEEREEQERRQREKEEAEQREKERKQREEEERKRKEERERLEKEEEERKRREEEERLQREQEEAERREKERKQREEDEKKRKEESERLKKEEEERKRREEERLQRQKEEAEQREKERKQREEDEKKRKEERERLKKEAEERKRREEEKRLQSASKYYKNEFIVILKREQEEAERKEKERKQREEDEKKRKEKREQLKKEAEERKRREEEKRLQREKEETERKEKERKQREEDERKRKEERERLKKEEEERKRREEEKRLQREREEAEIKAEQERLRKEEERIRREEEERLKRQEEDRIKQETEEKRLKEEAERKRIAEAAARRKEEERKRREKERKVRELLKKEAEEKAWRQDPNNWKPVVYERQCDEVDGRREYHGGVSCVLTSPPGGIEEDDVQSLASDEVDSVITVLEDDEKPVSSIIDVESRKGKLHSEVPSRLYVPHHQTINSSDEIVVKSSINGGDWTTAYPVQTTQNMSDFEKSVKRMAGIEVNDFTNIKLLVVSRPKSQLIIVDRPGASVYSTVDNQVKLFVPRDTFENRTEMRMRVQTVNSTWLNELMKDIPDLDNVLSVGSLITLQSQKPTRQSIEVDLLKPTTKSGLGPKFQRGRFYQLYACRDNVWRIAEVEYKGQQNNVSVGLPVGRDKIIVMELEVPSTTSKEILPNIAKTLYECIINIPVVMLVRQKSTNPEMLTVRIVRKDDIKRVDDYLESIGFDTGPDVTGEFLIKEFQSVEIICTGNIETDSQEKIKLQYISYKGGISTTFTVKVKDIYKQKDLPSFIGTIRCALLKECQSGSEDITSSLEVTITLPKVSRPKSTVGTARVRLPFYLTSMVKYLSTYIEKDGLFEWQSVLETLIGKHEFNTGYRNAMRKIEDIDDEVLLFKTILLDWMKAQQKHVDKIKPILSALIRNGHTGIASQCQEYVIYQKTNISDEVLNEMSRKATRNVNDIGKELGLSEHIITKCINAHSGNNQRQIEELLAEWREFDDVTRHDNVRNFLKHVCRKMTP
ncbi:Death domain-containing protein 1 [Mactra antiquata]